jgi:hypothetical protein
MGPRGMGVGYGPNSMNQTNPQRPPNMQVAPDGMTIQQQEWRHLMMTQQQQNMNFGGNTMNRNNFNGGTGVQGKFALCILQYIQLFRETPLQQLQRKSILIIFFF